MKTYLWPTEAPLHILALQQTSFHFQFLFLYWKFESGIKIKIFCLPIFSPLFSHNHTWCCHSVPPVLPTHGHYENFPDPQTDREGGVWQWASLGGNVLKLRGNPIKRPWHLVTGIIQVLHALKNWLLCKYGSTLPLVGQVHHYGVKSSWSSWKLIQKTWPPIRWTIHLTYMLDIINIYILIIFEILNKTW